MEQRGTRVASFGQTEINWDKLDKTKFYVVGAGLFTGITVALYPVSVVKTRLQVASKDIADRTTYSAVRTILKADEYFHAFTVPHVSLYVKKTWHLSVVAQCSSEVQANAAETLCAITRNMGSPLTAKVCSLGFVSRIFSHALEDSSTKSGLVHSLFISISLLDPRWSSSSLLMHSLRGQHMYEAPIAVNPETTNTMLPRLDLRVRVSIDEIKNVKEV